MVFQLRSRRFWVYCLAAIIALGLASRAGHTGFVVIDKYLGDALYAAMVYILFRLALRPARALPAAALSLLAIELFQLTGFAAHLLHHPSPLLRAAARLLGTHFSPYDLLAYAAGLATQSRLEPRTQSAHSARTHPDAPEPRTK